MTYIIAEPCIDIKDRSCVDVCPVDCIHEYDRILVIDPEECIDCFAPTEQLITSHGVRTFAELENKSCRVLTDSGFKPAAVKRFRRRPLVKIELGPAFEERDRYGGTRLTTRNISRFRRTVWATPTHKLGPRRRPGDERARRRAVRPGGRGDTDTGFRDIRLGVLHGLVFGDGAWNKQEIRFDEHLHYVQLYGERAAKFRDLFDQVNFSPCLDVHPGYAGPGASCLVREPQASASRDGRRRVHRRLRRRLARRRRGSCEGRLLADPLDHHEALAWLEQAAAIAGYVAVGSEARRGRGDELRSSRPIRWLYLATGSPTGA